MRRVPVQIKKPSNRLTAARGWRGLGDSAQSSETAAIIVQSEPSVEVSQEEYIVSDDVPTLTAEQQETISTFAAQSAKKEGFFPSMDSVSEFIGNIWSGLQEEAKKSTINKISSNADNIASNAAVFIKDKCLSSHETILRYEGVPLDNGIVVHVLTSFETPITQLLIGAKGVHSSVYVYPTAEPNALNQSIQSEQLLANGKIERVVTLYSAPHVEINLDQCAELAAQALMLSLGACVLGYETDIFAADKNSIIRNEELQTKMEQSIYSGALIVNILQKQSEFKIILDIINTFWGMCSDVLIGLSEALTAVTPFYDGTFVSTGISLDAQSDVQFSEADNDVIILLVKEQESDFEDDEGATLSFVKSEILGQFNSDKSDLLGRLDMYALEAELHINEMSESLNSFKDSVSNLLSRFNIQSSVSLADLESSGKEVEQTLSNMQSDVRSSDSVTSGFTSLASITGLSGGIFELLDDVNRVSFTAPLAVEDTSTEGEISKNGEWLGPLPPPKDIFSVLVEAGVPESSYLASILDYSYAQSTGKSLAADAQENPNDVIKALSSMLSLENLKANVTAFLSSAAAVVGLQSKDVQTDTKALDASINTLFDEAKRAAGASPSEEAKAALAAISALRDQALSINERSRQLASRLEGAAKDNVIAISKSGIGREQLSAMGTGTKLALGAVIGAALFLGARAILKKK